MSNAPKIFRKGQTVTVTHYACPGHESLSGAHMGESVYCSGRCDDREEIGTEEAEVIGIVSIYTEDAGMIWVRPFNSDDQIKVHIRDMEAAV